MALTYAQHAAAVAARAALALAAAQTVDGAFELHQRVNEILWKPRADDLFLDVWSDEQGNERLHQGGVTLVRHFAVLRVDIGTPNAEGDTDLYAVADALTSVFLPGTDGLGFGVPGRPSNPAVTAGAVPTADLTTPTHQGSHWMAQARYPYDWLRQVA